MRRQIDPETGKRELVVETVGEIAKPENRVALVRELYWLCNGEEVEEDEAVEIVTGATTRRVMQ